MFALVWTSYFLLLLVVVATDTGAASETSCDPATDDYCPAESQDLDPTVKRWIDELHTDDSMYLNGSWMKPTSDPNNAIPVVDPSTGRQISRVSVASKLDVDMAVIAARRAFEAWSIDTAIEERSRLVRKLYSLYEDHGEKMAQLISHELGAPIELSREEQVGSGSYHMGQFLHEVGEGGNFAAEYRLDDDEDTTIMYQAIGVVGLITPWNWPMNQIALKVIPALLVGCTVILKPSEQTPLSALLFGQLIHTAGFPPGVFQLVNGYGPNHVGEWLASHPDVDMVSFTGSTRGGKQVSSAAAPTLKRVSLEMGGKGANVIFDDLIDEDDEYLEDFYYAVESGVYAVMSNSGQTCNAPTRMLVPQRYWDLALATAKEVASSIQVRSAHEEGGHIGPVVSQTQYERIQGFIRSGIDQGATLLVGGLGKPEELPKRDQGGYYVRPTIFVDCSPDMTIWREEIFGPVLCMTTFNDEEEAIRLANDSPYGLTHYAHTYDAERRRRLTQKLQSGMVVMNHVGLSSSSPFGGVKQSGNSREGGVWGLEDFCIVKAVSGLNGDNDDE